MYALKRALPLALVPVLATAALTVRLSDETLNAFDAYVKQVEAGMNATALGRLAEVRASVTKGEIVAVPFPNRAPANSASIPIRDGLVNHWLGVMFIPGATVEQVRGVLQNYGQYKEIYAPDVTESRRLRASGDEFDVFLRLHRQIRVKALLGYSFPVEFNSEYHVRYFKTGETLHVRSVATRIAEVKEPKKSHTEEYEVGNDSGYLWRLRSYWRIYPADGGVLVECEAVSLSRSVPGFVERLVTYFTTNFPENSMRHTLKATRAAVTGSR
jgi:hypothetical protein